MKVLKEFLDACNEKREIEDIAPVELQEIIKKFVLAVRKKNGEEYEPSSIRAFIQSIEKTIMDCPSLTTKNFKRFKIF